MRIIERGVFLHVDEDGDVHDVTMLGAAVVAIVVVTGVATIIGAGILTFHYVGPFGLIALIWAVIAALLLAVRREKKLLAVKAKLRKSL